MKQTALAVMLMFAAPGGGFAQTPPDTAPVEPAPYALVSDGVPHVPKTLVDETLPYMEFRTAGFSDWDPASRAMLITTRFGDVNQIHRVAMPGGARQQLTFGLEPVNGGSFAPDGAALVFQRDTGGNEVFQLYALQSGKPRLLSDGKSRNSIGPWSQKGDMLAFSSNRRTGLYNDIYVMDPRQPDSARMLFITSSGGWFPIDFSPDGAQLLVFNYLSVTENQLHLIDVATGSMHRLTNHIAPVSFGTLKFAPDGRLWVTSDEGADVKRLGTMDLANGIFTPLIDGGRWDIDDFDISDDGRTIAYIVNDAGRSRLYIYDIAGASTRAVTALEDGIISNIRFAPWGSLGFSFSSNRVPTDAYSLDPMTLAITRWTNSESGGLDASVNALPELIEMNSFDGVPMSGYLYRPDRTRFPGKRPLIISVHGGPEGQSQPGYLGRNNYLVNELGIALFYPNVRGSTGFGKAFVGLDNGPFRREDSVRDIGAFLKILGKDKALDDDRFAITGGSYGGYMVLASLLAYPRQLQAGLEIVGISNFVTFLENTEEYRRDLRRVEYGDERVPEQRTKLQAISPLTRAADIALPLMVVTGGNDPRVPPTEADQIIAAVRATGREAWHLRAANEGHGFRRKENVDYQFWASLMFWQRNLLGVVESGVR